MLEEFNCPKCGLVHRRLKHDTPETKIRCIGCGLTFKIKEAAQAGVQRDLADVTCYNGNHPAKDGICLVDGGHKPSSR
jgi:transcription elongation factor Elf1